MIDIIIEDRCAPQSEGICVELRRLMPESAAGLTFCEARMLHVARRRLMQVSANGQCFKLTQENQDAEVRSLFVTDTNIYAAGVINDQAVCWKDGVVTFLSSGGISSKANSISVLETDVYVAGQEDKYTSVWKNSVKQNIPNQDKQGEIKVVVVVSN